MGSAKNTKKNKKKQKQEEDLSYIYRSTLSKKPTSDTVEGPATSAKLKPISENKLEPKTLQIAETSTEHPSKPLTKLQPRTGSKEATAQDRGHKGQQLCALCICTPSTGIFILYAVMVFICCVSSRRNISLFIVDGVGPPCSTLSAPSGPKRIRAYMCSYSCDFFKMALILVLSLNSSRSQDKSKRMDLAKFISVLRVNSV